MAEPAGPFRELRAGPRRFLCYCGGDAVRVTDGREVWAAELGARPRGGAAASQSSIRAEEEEEEEEEGARVRRALERGAAALGLRDGGAPALQLRHDAWSAALQLRALPGAEAGDQLQALVFALAGRVQELQRRLEATGARGPSCSPEKNAARSQQLFMPDPRSRKSRGAGSTVPAKRRVPGESLINPGFKSKKTPAGVDFEDS
ncbi:protein PAXX [Eudromia elegans]